MPWAAVAETATAAVFLVGDLAVKVKKPLDFGYVDFRTAAARRHACEEEVRLNRRLAPDVYLGVGDLVGADGAVIDHVVLMRRMPTARRLTAVLRRNGEARAGLQALARQLADFHARSPVDDSPDSPGSFAGIERLWAEEIEALDNLAAGLVPTSTRNAIAVLADQYLAGRSRLFDERLHAGLVRDGHGDLLADDIFLLDDGPRVLDCLEFDDRFRIADVWLDVAFLAMDLERLDAAEAARLFLDDYREFSGTSVPASLLHFYVAYRAHVRAKVAAVRSAQGGYGAAEQSRRLAEMALEHLQSGAVTMTLVGGLPGSGKTTLAATLAAEQPAVHLSSDVIRKELHGEAGEPSAYEGGIYTRAATARTYAELLHRARLALELGESVVLDATWRDAGLRELARQVAGETSSVLVEIQCTVAEPTAVQRLQERSTGPSDATVEIRARMRDRFDRWPEARHLSSGRPDTATLAWGAVRRAVRQVQRSARTLGPGSRPTQVAL